LDNTDIVLSAFNIGARRDRLVQMTVDHKTQGRLADMNGLAGYVLARSKMEWKFPAGGLKPGDKITITAQGDSGKVQATVPVEAPN
jgi:hypothetical protein